MFGIFDTKAILKQTVLLHIKNLECLELHYQIKQDVFEFKTELLKIQYPSIDFQIAIEKGYREVIDHNSAQNKRISKTKKYLQNYATRL